MITVLGLLNVIAVVIVCYLGPGRLVSRLINTNQRRNPLFWVFMSTITVPIYISVRSIFGEVSHIEVFIMSGIALILSFLPIPPIFRLLKEKKSNLNFSSFFLIIGTVTIFLLALLGAKYQLLVGAGDTGASDDLSRVQVVVSAGRSLSSPSEYTNIDKPLTYHYYDYLLAGTLFRLTNISAQAAWFTHNIIEYMGILSFIAYVGLYLFRTTVGRWAYVLMATITGGGLDYFFYKIKGWKHSLPGGATGLSLEQWSFHLGKLNAGKKPFEIWSQFYLFQWNPHHTLAATIFLLILVLLSRKDHRENYLFVAVLMGGLLGFSVYVFITSLFSILVAEFFWGLSGLVRKGPGFVFSGFRRKILFILVLIMVFSIVLVPQLQKYMGASFPGRDSGPGGYVKREPLILNFTDTLPFLAFLPQQVQPVVAAIDRGLAYFYTISFIYFVDLGLVLILAMAYFLVMKRMGRGNKRALNFHLFWTFLVTTAIIFSFRSFTYNDIFSRGVMVLQVVVILAAAKFIDAWGGLSRKVWLVIPLLFLFNSQNFFHGLNEEVYFPEHKPLNSIDYYSRYNTPKNAVVYSDVLCRRIDRVVFYLNRHCMSSSLEQVLGKIESGEIQTRNTYFLSDKALREIALNEVASSDDSVYLYEIKSSLP